MSLISQFEAYITAQKDVGTQFVIIGLVLLAIATWAHFFIESDLSKGLRTSALVCGALIIAGGFAYRSTESNLLKTQTLVFQNDQNEFRQSETKRMIKVKKDYPIYQIVFGGLVILSIIIILMAKNPYWHGISFGIIILMVGVMIAEAYSKKSITDYHQVLIEQEQ